MSDSDATAYKRWPQFLAVWTSLLAVFCCRIPLDWYDLYLLKAAPRYHIYFMAIGYVGQILGNIFFTLLVDTIGRKKTIFLIGVPQLISTLMIYLSNYSLVLVFSARFIGCLSEGAWLTVLPIYISEISEPRIRGFLGSSFSLVLTLEFMFGTFVGEIPLKISTHTSPGVFFIFMFIFVVLFSFMPESPYFLVMKNRKDEAYTNLKKLRDSQNVNEELTSLVEVVQRQMEDKGTFKEMWTIKSIRKALLIMIILRMLELCIDSVLYLPVKVLDADNFTVKIILSILRIVFTLIGAVLVDFIGRRPLLLFSVGSSCLILFLISIYLCFFNTNSILVYGFWGIFIACYSIGLGTVVNLLLGELFPVRVKAIAICLINIVFVGGKSISTTFHELTWGKDWAIPYLLFVLFVQLVKFVVCIKFLPETKKKTLGEIQQELKQ